MTTPAIHEVRELDTAEELFQALSPTGSLWSGHPFERNAEVWVLRGQSNGPDERIWKLIPSAFRPSAFLKYKLAQIEEIPAQDASEQRSREMNAVMAFANTVDRHGLVIPGDSHEIRDDRVASKIDWQDYRAFPPPQLAALFGLAQHHGVPTRLLDWTWKPLVAVYFAAEAVARRRAPGVKPAVDAPFSVFALRRAVFEDAKHLDPAIIRVHAPSATNANLHAQGGMFTVVQPLSRDELPLPDLREVLDRHRDALSERYDGMPNWPVLIEFRVPACEARTTLMLLERSGVTAASIYPGLGGVARALEEPRYYQWARPGERS